jgi:hypothetical protein
MNSKTKKQHKSRKDNISTMGIENESKPSNGIIDIDDSPDVATWNKEVTRNKEHVVKDIKVSEETKNKFRINKISPQIPPITTVGLRREDNEENDDHIDPANQKEVDKIHKLDGKLTDHATLFNNKRKYTKNQKSK